MLRTSRTDPKLSVYQVLGGTHDFNRVPFATPGCQAKIFNPPKIRTIWGPIARDAWYCSLSYEFYRAWKFRIPSTGGFRKSAQATFYPKHCTMATETLMDTISRVEITLTRAIQKLENKTKHSKDAMDKHYNR